MNVKIIGSNTPLRNLAATSLLVVLCCALPLEVGITHAAAPHTQPGDMEKKPQEQVNRASEAHSATTHAVHTGGKEKHGGKKHATHTKHADHAAAHGGAHTEPPSMYYLNWVLLGFTFVAACSYCLLVYKRGKPKHEGLGLALLLVFLVIALYVSNQFPELQRHFDEASHRFIDGYHEPAGTGFIKFLYKMALGIFLMIYGLIGRGHH